VGCIISCELAELSPPTPPAPAPSYRRRKIRDNPNCLTIASRPGLLESLRRHATTLDIVRRSWTSTSSSSTHPVPRFYFLSNDRAH